MKKLKTLILAALTAGGACAAFGFSSTYIKADSTVWFDTASVPEGTTIDPAQLPKAVKLVVVTLPTEVLGCSYVVSNLTEDVEIEPTEAGGSDYILPHGKTVGIYAVPEEGYVVTGTNPYVIEEVTEGTTLDASKLPTAVRKGTLCFTSEADGSTVWMKVVGTGWTPPTVQYLIEGKGWKTVTYGQKLKLSKGDKVWFRGDNPVSFSVRDDQYVGFQMTGQVAASGSVMSLIDPTLETTAIPRNYCFTGLFYNCPALTAAPELPATELKASCYDRMFYSCTSLTTAPELPATELKDSCYSEMFKGCTSLNQVRVGFSAWEPSNATSAWLYDVAKKGMFFHLSPLEISTYGSSTVPVGWAVVPWYVGASDPMDALAWVDETLKAVVVDNGMPGATNAIDLVTLADEMMKFGYEPTKELANVFLTYAPEDGEVAYLKPVAWFDADDVTKTYPTLADALAAGETAVVPNFVTEEIPQEIAETGKGEDGKTYTAVLENKSAEDVLNPVKAAYAKGLIDIATAKKVNVRMTVTPKSEDSVPEDVARLLKLASTEDLDDLSGYKVDYVDLSVWYGDAKQTELDSVVAVHVPWNRRQDRTYRVARMHMHSDGQEGSWAFPIGEENADDGEYVEFGADEIIVHTKKFSLYSITVIGKDAGEEEPVEPATIVIRAKPPRAADGAANGYTYTEDALAAGDSLVATVEVTTNGDGFAVCRIASYAVLRGVKDVTKEYVVVTVDSTVAVDPNAEHAVVASAKEFPSVAKGEEVEVGTPDAPAIVDFQVKNAKFSVGANAKFALVGEMRNAKTVSVAAGAKTRVDGKSVQGTTVADLGVLVGTSSLKSGANTDVTVGYLSGTEKADAVSSGAKSVFAAGDIDLGAGSDKLTVGADATFAAGDLYEVETLAFGARSTNEIGNVVGAQKLTVSAGKAATKKTAAVPTMLVAGDVEMLPGKANAISLGKDTETSFGDVLLGSGNDKVTVGDNATAIFGAIAFGGGKDKVTVGKNCTVVLVAYEDDCASLTKFTIGKGTTAYLSSELIAKGRKLAGSRSFGDGATLVDIGPADVAYAFTTVEEERLDNVEATAQTLSGSVTGWLSDVKGADGVALDGDDFFVADRKLVINVTVSKGDASKVSLYVNGIIKTASFGRDIKIRAGDVIRIHKGSGGAPAGYAIEAEIVR